MDGKIPDQDFKINSINTKHLKKVYKPQTSQIGRQLSLEESAKVLRVYIWFNDEKNALTL